MKRLMLLVALATLAAGACGSSGASSKAGNPAQDNKTAQAVSLRQSDLPASFQASPPNPSPAVKSANRSIYSTCLNKPFPADHSSADVSSPTYSQGLAEAVSSTVILARNTNLAQQDLATISSPQFATCAQKGFPRSFAATAPPGATATDFRVASEPAPGGAPGAVAYRFRALIHRGTITIPLNVDRVYVVRSRTELTLSFNNVGSPFPRSLETMVVAKVLARM